MVEQGGSVSEVAGSSPARVTFSFLKKKELSDPRKEESIASGLLPSSCLVLNHCLNLSEEPPWLSRLALVLSS